MKHKDCEYCCKDNEYEKVNRNTIYICRKYGYKIDPDEEACNFDCSPIKEKQWVKKLKTQKP